MRLMTTARFKNTAQTSLRPEKAVAMGLAREKRQWGGGRGDRSPSSEMKGKWEKCETRRALKVS